MKVSKKDISYFSIQLGILFGYFIPINLTEFPIPILLTAVSLVLLLMGFAMAVIAIFQLSKKLSPFPSPAKNAVLQTRGVYKLSRHPIYTGLFLMTLAFGIMTGSLWKILFSVVLLAFFYVKSNYEEELLSEKFQEYGSYQKKTGRFFPKF